MDIIDYIPTYPELVAADFNRQIYAKNEFYELETNTSVPTNKPGDLWNHQQLIQRFLSPYTTYTEQLLFHTPGTGKTCAAVAVAEINKWTGVDKRRKVIILVPSETLKEQWKKQIAFTCTSGEYIPDNYFDTDPNERLTAEQKSRRLTAKIESTYYITGLEAFRRQIDKLSPERIQSEYSNSIIIIDEAHNLRIQKIAPGDDPKGRYESYHKFLHLIKNSKKILLTGTPIYDNITELPSLLNLLLPINAQLPTGDEFIKKYMSPTKTGYYFKQDTDLTSRLIGLVSYIREGGDFPKRIDAGKPIWTTFLKNYSCPLGDIQQTGYLAAYRTDSNKGEIGTSFGWTNTRQASVFAYPYENRTIWGDEAFGILTEVVGREPVKIQIDGTELKEIPMRIRDKYARDIVDNLEKYSSKIKHIIDIINANQAKPIFIYTPIVNGAGGAIFIGLILQLYGFSRADGTSTAPAKRYAIVTGETKSGVQRKKLIDTFNSPKNIDGSIIQILIASKTIAEGTSLINTRVEIIISPWWNNSSTEQAIGRGLRANSLLWMNPEDRSVEVYQLAITSDTLPVEKNIDAHMYLMSERKDFEIKGGERLLKTVAWDCPLNYARNVVTNAADFSRECDYQKCNYACNSVAPDTSTKKWTYSLPVAEINYDTYLLYYSGPAIFKIIEIIRKLLREKSFLDISDLHQLSGYTSFKLLVLAIEYMINNNVHVYNKWGIQCYLRKHCNMLFLSNDKSNHIFDAWYAKYPYVNSYNSLDEIVDGEIYAKSLLYIDCKESMYNNLHLSVQIKLVEDILANDGNITTDEGARLFADTLVHFQLNILRNPNDKLRYIHNLYKIKIDDLGYVDNTLGEKGRLRCLPINGEWRDCTVNESSTFTSAFLKQTIQSSIAASAVASAPVSESESESDASEPIKPLLTGESKLFLIMDGSVLKIIDKTTETQKANTDKRAIARGRACNNKDKADILVAYTLLNAPIPDNVELITLTNEDALRKIINSNNCGKNIPENPSIEKLQYIATLSKITKPELCAFLKKWAIENGILLSKNIQGATIV